MKRYRMCVMAGLAAVMGCALLGPNYEQLYGPAAPKDRIVSSEKMAAAGYVSFEQQVRPILTRRCIVCHSCYDAPCQLNLTSYEGLDRGASREPVYNGARLSTARPTRLGIDAHTTTRWRELGFHPVLNERADTREANLDNSLLYKALQLKRADPFPTSGRLPESYAIGSELETDRNSTSSANQCPVSEGYEAFAKSHPQWGMPFGFPGVSDKEFTTIESWLAQGAPVEPIQPLSVALQSEIAKWEAFLNGGSNKQRLMARYLYEHLFLGHLYFDEVDQSRYFMLVRSRTAPGAPIDVIASVRPYDEPGVDRFYYRLQRYDRAIVDKTHMPYALNDRRLSRLEELFLKPDYAVAELPPYEPELAANPFKTFAAIPPRSRYQFMLDEAHFIMSGFIKGPVCNGSVALSVIDDHFWVLFTDPDHDPVSHDGDFQSQESVNLRIPSEREEHIGLIDAWHAYFDYARRYFLAKLDYWDRVYPKGQGVGLEQIWDGGKTNRDAALTVYRHFDSATVVQGFVGEIPKTGWVLDYPLFERIHYLLVAGFNVYGAAGHQLATRTYMDFLRMEAELNFLLFLPREQRLPLYRHWYRKTNQPEKLERLIGESVKKYGVRTPAIVYETEDGKKEFFVKVYEYLGNARSSPDTINWCRAFPVHCAALKQDPRTQAVETAFRELSNTKGKITDVFPNVTFVRVIVDGSLEGDLVYSLVRNKAYLNTMSLVPSEGTRFRPEDSIDVLKGFVGAYPNFFLELRLEDLQVFVDEYVAIDSLERYDAFIDMYGIRRSNPRFWERADWFNAKYGRDRPVHAGIFDLSRYENR
ncbi:9-hexadecenoic acid cis-trans isomerase [Nitrospira sp.]|nr:9-hexadecenoic acid cis-trans isomerase [Nitrospira sp.]